MVVMGSALYQHSKFGQQCVPLTLFATSRYRASFICCVQFVSVLMPLLFSRATALLFLSWLQRTKGRKGRTFVMVLLCNSSQCRCF